MQFGNTEFYPALLLLPLLFVFVRAATKKQQRSLYSFADETLLPEVQKEYKRSKRARSLRSFWSLVVATLLMAVLLRPQWGFTWKESSKTGIDLVVAVDVSESMLATDVKPNRLVRAQRELIDLLNQVKGDRLGLVAFAGVAFTETPLTLDYGAFRSYISSLNPSLIPIHGTNIESALRESIRTLQKGQGNIATGKVLKNRAQAILLITDGEHFEGDLSGIRKEISELGIQVYIIGVGTEEGAPIPTPKGHKRDKLGNVIISKLQAAAIQQLAVDSGGIYVNSIIFLLLLGLLLLGVLLLRAVLLFLLILLLIFLLLLLFE